MAALILVRAFISCVKKVVVGFKSSPFILWLRIQVNFGPLGEMLEGSIYCEEFGVEGGDAFSEFNDVEGMMGILFCVGVTFGCWQI